MSAPLPAEDILVDVSNVDFAYDKRPILSGINLRIPRGKLVAIMGGSGCGKTTLLRLIGGQLRPTGGQIRVAEHDLASLSRRDMYRLRRRVGMLFQFGALFTDLSVFENVAFPLREHTDLPEDMIRDLVLNALLMALWRRQPRDTVLVHSDQGCQFTGHDWQGFLRDHNLVSSMSRRGNCHDNAVAESFFQLLKRERIRRQIYPTRQDARADVFNYIEMFYNPKRRHNTSGGVSPVEFEKRQSQRLGSV